MATFALIDGANAVLKYADYAQQPADPVGKGWKWLPVVDTDPSYDAATQVKTGPVVTVGASNVTRVWTVRAKTAPELDAEKQAKADGLDLVILEILFNHENRIRALNSQAAITKLQFRNAIKALL